jgi:Na+-transporting methylmalonyl-CoA/oxaloacetate decarboxylase gamma subunit
MIPFTSGIMKSTREESEMGKSKTVVIAVLCLLIFGVWGLPAMAQQPASPQPAEAQAEAMEQIQLTRTAIAAERQAIITKAMDLTPQEMQGFWPLYRDYRLEAAKIGDRTVALISTYAENYENLTDPVANQLLTEFVGIEKERARLKEKYLAKFKKVLPPRKVVRFYQLENKLDITILNEMAQNIPLVR